jgi:putative endonuclease
MAGVQNPKHICSDPPMDERFYYVYILASRTQRLYIGVTNSLRRRVAEHKGKSIDGFTKRYNIDQLVYYEAFTDVRNAITREKRLKNWPRVWKIKLIEGNNPEWRDLAEDWYADED